MARKENTKAKEKRRERKLMELKMNLGWALQQSNDWIKNCVDVRWAKVKAAEIEENPLEALPSFTVFNKNGVKFNLETKKY